MTPMFSFNGQKGSGRIAGRKNSSGMQASGKVYSDTDQEMNKMPPVDHPDKEVGQKKQRVTRTSFFSSLRKNPAPSAKTFNIATGDQLHSPHSGSPPRSARSPRAKPPDQATHVPFFANAVRRLSDLVVDPKPRKLSNTVNTAEGISSLTEDHKADDQRNSPPLLRQSLDDMVPHPTKINANVDINTGRQTNTKTDVSGLGRLRLESLDGVTAFGLSGQSQRSDASDAEAVMSTVKFATKSPTQLNVASRDTIIEESSPVIVVSSPKKVHSRRVLVESMDGIDQKPDTLPPDSSDHSDRSDLAGMEFKASKESIAASAAAAASNHK